MFLRNLWRVLQDNLKELRSNPTLFVFFSISSDRFVICSTFTISIWCEFRTFCDLQHVYYFHLMRVPVFELFQQVVSSHPMVYWWWAYRRAILRPRGNTRGAGVRDVRDIPPTLLQDFCVILWIVGLWQRSMKPACSQHLGDVSNVGCDSQARVNEMKHNIQFDCIKRMQVFRAS